MKKLNRELNIFNMSALDLFASALGAFILITIILLPFFPNLDPTRVQEKLENAQAELDATMAETKELQAQLAESKAREQALQKQLKAETAHPPPGNPQAALAAAMAETRKLQAQLAESKARERALQKKLKAATAQPKKAKTPSRLAFPPLDLVIALDTTGSMEKQVEGLKNEIEQIARLLRKLAPSVGIGAIDFKDRCEGRRAVNAFTLVEMNNATLRNLSRFTRGIRAGNYTNCNHDLEEAVNLALASAVAMPWRSKAKVRVIIIISDSAAYPETQTTVLRQASRFAASREGNRVSTVYVPTQMHITGTGNVDSAFLKRLASAGKGQFVGGGGSFTATVLLALVDT